MEYFRDMKTVDVARIIHYIGIKDYKSASSVIREIIEKETNVNNKNLIKNAYASWGIPDKILELPNNLKRFVYPNNKEIVLNNLYLNDCIRKAIYYLIDSFNKKDILISNGLTPINKVLFAGPPGNGKTSVALALCKEIKAPLLKINMAEIISSHLGGTIKQLDSVFSEVNHYGKSILFFDEVDTLGTKRDYSDNCEKEMSRAVNKMLNEIDNLNSNILLIMATNVADELDPALLRRFNMKLWFKNPTREQIEKYIDEYFSKRDIDLDAEIMLGYEVLFNKSWSDVEIFCEAKLRSLILESETIFYGNEWIGK